MQWGAFRPFRVHATVLLHFCRWLREAGKVCETGPLHDAWMVFAGLLALVVVYPYGNVSTIDTWFFGASASAESGLNGVEVKDLKTYQQAACCFSQKADSDAGRRSSWCGPPGPPHKNKPPQPNHSKHGDDVEDVAELH
ncbi:hypothetical protein VTI74DRAFT_10865 [Chaetomium olivicolor]